MGRLLRTQNGLGPVADADILLMQEVHPERDGLEEALAQQTDLRIAVAAPELGLAIAAKDSVSVSTANTDILQERGPLGRGLVRLEAYGKPASFRTRARGVLAIHAATAAGTALTVATTHPIVPLKFRSRNEQVRRLGEKLQTHSGNLIVGGDMNHWPGPRRADRQMYLAAGVQPVDLQDEHTYRIEDSRHAWLGRIAGKHIPFNGQLDAVLFRGDALQVDSVQVADVASDHRAIIARFVVGASQP